jgi:hypothetical protein
MIGGRFSAFYIDVGMVSKDKHDRLETISIRNQDLGLGLMRYWFNYTNIREVEEILGDRIVIDVKHQKQHIADISFVEEGLGKISITMGSEAIKIDEMMRWKSIVADILEEDIKARNNDKWLFISVLKYLGYAIYADYEAIKNLPNPETLSRIRRKFQEQGLYPADPDVQHNRAECQKQMKDINKWYPDIRKRVE